MAILPSLDNLRGVLQRVLFVPIVYGLVSLLPLFLSGWESSDRVTDRVFSIFRSRENQFDFIVVGGGTAGALLANRLAEHYKVLLLEAGGTPNPFQTIPALSLKFLNHPQTDWSHRTVPQRRACLNSVNQQSSWSSGRGLGGTTNINFMLHTRGHPMDFESWAQNVGDESWGYAGVQPYFKRTETFSGISNDPEARGHNGELRIRRPSYTGLAEDWVRAGQELGYPFVDLNGRHEEGFGILEYPIYKGIRQSTYSAFLLPMHKSPRLTIRRYALVRKVLFRDANNRAYGVEYVRHGNVQTAIATKEVILSAGTLGSSKLLMLSGVGPKAHLEELGIPIRSDLPVGRNLQDHLGVHLGPFFIREPKSFLFDREVTPENIVRWLFLGTGPITTTGYQAAASIASSIAKSRGEGNWPDLHLVLHGQAIHKGYADAFAYAYGLQEDEITQYYSNAFGRDSFHITVIGARPTSTGQMLLSGASISDPLVINPRYLEDGGNGDFKILLEGVKTAMTVANTSIFQRFGTEFTSSKLPGCDDHHFGSDEYWECYIRRYTISMHNPVGTAALGQVVDTYLRVKGTKALRVVDASIQPTVVGSGTAASTFMIAEKGADLIMKDHGVPDRDRDLFDVIFGKEGFFKKNPVFRVLQREFDTLNPLRSFFKPFTGNKEWDARERFTRNSGLNNPLLQIVSNLFGHTGDHGASASSVSDAVNAVNVNLDSVDDSINSIDSGSGITTTSDKNTLFSDPPSITTVSLNKRLGEPSDLQDENNKTENVLDKNQWVLQTAESSHYTTPKALPILNVGSNEVIPLRGKKRMSEYYKRFNIPMDMPTVKGKGGRRYALLKAILQEEEFNASLQIHPTSKRPGSVVEVVKFQRHPHSHNHIVDTGNEVTADPEAKPIANNPYELGLISVTTIPESSAAKFKQDPQVHNPGSNNPFDELLRHLKTFENFFTSLSAQDKPLSWSQAKRLPHNYSEIPFSVSHSKNPFHQIQTSGTNIFSSLAQAFNFSGSIGSNNGTRGPFDIGFGTNTSPNGTVNNPFAFLFNPILTTTMPPTNGSGSNKNDSGGLGGLFASWFNPQPKSPSTSSWFKPFETTSPIPPGTSWFKPFGTNTNTNNNNESGSNNGKQPPLVKSISLNEMSNWFKLSTTPAASSPNSSSANTTTPSPPTMSTTPKLTWSAFGKLKSSPTSSSSSWFRPFNYDSDTRSAVALTTPGSIPPTSDPLADLFDLFFGGLRKHEKRAIYQSLESMAQAGQNLVDLFGNNGNQGRGHSQIQSQSQQPGSGPDHMKNFFELIATGKATTSNPLSVNPSVDKTAESYNELMQSLVQLNTFFNQLSTTANAATSSTTTPKPHPIIEYLSTFDYPISSSSTTTTSAAPPTLSTAASSIVESVSSTSSVVSRRRPYRRRKSRKQ